MLLHARQILAIYYSHTKAKTDNPSLYSHLTHRCVLYIHLNTPFSTSVAASQGKPPWAP